MARFFISIVSAILGTALAGHAFAETKPIDLCNQSSFVVDVALGFQTGDGAATKGWFRSNPGTCIEVIKDDVGADRLLLHARPLPLYGAPPDTEATDSRLCIREPDFVIAGATECVRDGQVMANFVYVTPEDNGERQAIAIDEPADYSLASASTAGIQRLLALVGYDVGLVDGLSGSRTQAALDSFLSERDVPRTDGNAVLQALIETAMLPQNRAIPRFCNETFNRLMLAVGAERGSAIETRGWFEMAPGACIKPFDRPIQDGKVYTFAEAVDQFGVAIIANGQQLIWSGNAQLCTKNIEFTIRNHETCEARGMSTSGFREWEIESEFPLVVRFESPLQ